MARAANNEPLITVGRFLCGVRYPASRDDIITKARENRASEGVLRVMRRLEGEEFGGPQEVFAAYDDARCRGREVTKH